MTPRMVVFLAVVVMALMVTSVIVPIGSAASTGPSAPSAAVVAPAAAPSTAPSAIQAPLSGVSPHPGTLDVFEVVPGGLTSLDPSVNFDTVSFEPVLNIFQSLVSYNGSSTASILPQLATCVPGTTLCTSLYGSTLITNNVHGLPQYWTFVIDSAARFYDPSTGASWGVYPSDVMFSLARTLSFANLPSPALTSGYLTGSALLNPGNGSWDHGIHNPYNNTPENVLGSMLVNDSAYCPTAAMAQHGCITFDAYGGGNAVPYFLELVEDMEGAGVQSCGWSTFVGAGVPGFNGTTAAHGDGPCLLPFGSTSTNSTTFHKFMHSITPEYWDNFQTTATAGWPANQPAVQFNAVGSGPYYLSSVSKSSGYQLKANPAYVAPTGCAGQTGCSPAAGSYLGTVNVAYEPDDSESIAQYKAGTADFAGIESIHTNIMLGLQSLGKIGVTPSIASLSIFFMPMNLLYNLTTWNTIDPTPGTTNVPQDFLSYIALRSLITNSFTYASNNNTLWTTDGVNYGWNYGGMIPKGMGDYYPTNISWPDQDPVSNPAINGSAGWWWAQANNPASPYYDHEMAACTPANPCKFAVVGQLPSGTAYNLAFAALINELKSITNGALQPYEVDLSFSDLLTFGFANPGKGGLGLFNLGWSPDYPDPTDYIGSMVTPNDTYTGSNSVFPQLNLPQFDNVSACGHASANSFADLVYWANHPIPNKCQGVAYNIGSAAYADAAPILPGTYRTLLYNLGEHILNNLSLYVYMYQEATPVTYAPWINPATISTNPTTGASAVNAWYQIGYVQVGARTLTFNETGLRAGTTWSVTAASQTVSSNTSTVTMHVNAGNYSYAVAYTPGYGVSPSSGTVTVGASNVVVPLNFTAFSGLLFPLTFTQQGIVTGSGAWAINVAGVGQTITLNTVMTYNLPTGTYNYTSSNVIGYNNTGSGRSGSVVLSASGANQNVVYPPLLFKTFSVTLSETGLPTGTEWSAVVDSFAQTVATPSVVFWEENGTHGFEALSTDYSAAPATGPIVVHGSNALQSVAFTLVTYPVTFNESGLLPLGTSWSVSIGGTAHSSTNTTIVIPLQNGSYTYTIAQVGLYTAVPSSGSFAVRGASIAVATLFIKGYAVAFTEQGLAPGATWSVTMNGATTSSTASQITLGALNGSYTFTASSTGYTATPSSGNLLVNGAGITTLVTFNPTTGSLLVTMGSNSGAQVFVTSSLGITVNSTIIAGGTHTFGGLLAGTYAIEAVQSGYLTYFNNVTVAGSSSPTPAAISMVGTPSSSPSSSYLSSLAYAIIGVFVALTIIFLATTVYFMRRRPPTSPPPQNWSTEPGSSSGTGSEAKGGPGGSS